MDKPIKPTKRHALKIFDWCIEKYGISKYNRIVPIIEFKKGDYYTEGCMAFYDEIESTIFIDKTLHHDLQGKTISTNMLSFGNICYAKD
jgi:hypothetical protein